MHASLSLTGRLRGRADESFETVSVDRIYIYVAMGRLRPQDGLISMKDLQVLRMYDGSEDIGSFLLVLIYLVSSVHGFLDNDVKILRHSSMRFSRGEELLFWMAGLRVPLESVQATYRSSCSLIAVASSLSPRHAVLRFTDVPSTSCPVPCPPQADS